MAGELIHTEVGTVLTEAEFDATTGHSLNSQATGDLIYASSASQLTRLAIGSTNAVLQVVGGVPTWVTAITLGGAITATGYGFVNLANSTMGENTVISQGVNTSLWYLRGGLNAAGGGAYICLYGVAHGATGKIEFVTPNAAGDGDLARFSISGKATTAVGTWANITHTGLKLSGALDVAGQYLSFTERAAPGAGAADTARVYAIVGGDTLTDLAAVFQDGTVDIFAQEATPLDSPVFTQPSQTEVKIKMIKEHPGSIQFVAVYPNGKSFTLRELQYHDPEKIAANLGAENPLPTNWLVENAGQRKARLEAEAAQKLAESIVPK